MTDATGEPLANREFDLPRDGRLCTGPIIHAYAGKRVLTRGVLAGRGVVAKFYLGRWRGWREWRRGLRGARALVLAGVDSPAIRFAGYLSAAGAWLTVLDHVELDEDWPPNAAHTDHRVHRRLLETLAIHHRRGIVQNDLNWTNFLPSAGRLYSIDGDRVRQYRPPLDRRRSLRNIARFYAYKSGFDEDAIAHGYHVYCAARDWSPDPGELAGLLQRIFRRRRTVARNIARRSLRGWKHYQLRRAGRSTSIIDRRRLSARGRERLATMPPPAEGAMEPRIVEFEGMRIRAHAVGGRALPWRRGPVADAWYTLVVLRRLRIATETPVGMTEQRDRGAVTRGWIFTLAMDAQPLHAVRDQRECQPATLDRLAGLLRRMRHGGLRLVTPGLDGFALTGEGDVLVDPMVVRRARRHDSRWRRDLRRLRAAAIEELGAEPGDADRLLDTERAPAGG